jgi:hypothetical protein
MDIKNILVVAGILLAIAACKNKTGKQSQGQTGLAVAPALRQADSLQILYYDDPDGDSLRYTRFYQYVTTKDRQTIDELLASLDQPVEKHQENRKCRSEGKIYLFNKEANPIKTVYFSTRCDTCCYLYYIVEGHFYYTPVSEAFKNRLKVNKAISRKP